MDDSLITLFGAGGPLFIIGAIVTFLVKEWRTSRDERRNAVRVSAESDSAVVAATKDVVGLIRSEIGVAIAQRNEYRTRALEAEERADKLEDEKDELKDANNKLRRQIREFREGRTPSHIPEEVAS